jgi:hypothetical protein
MKQISDKNHLSEVPLKHAWHIFATERAKKALENYSHKKYLQYNNDDKHPPSWQGAFNDLHNIIQEYQKSKSMIKAMEWQVRDKLSNGELVAYGYPVDAARQSKRTAIPAEFWDNATIEWNKGIASDDIAQYYRIRVAVVQHVTALAPAYKKRSGRPSERETIIEAIRVRDLAGPDFKNLGQKLKKKQIREQIKHDDPNVDPDGPGYNDKTLEKYIREYYK